MFSTTWTIMYKRCCFAACVTWKWLSCPKVKATNNIVIYVMQAITLNNFMTVVETSNDNVPVSVCRKLYYFLPWTATTRTQDLGKESVRAEVNTSRLKTKIIICFACSNQFVSSISDLQFGTWIVFLWGTQSRPFPHFVRGLTVHFTSLQGTGIDMVLFMLCLNICFISMKCFYYSSSPKAMLLTLRNWNTATDLDLPRTPTE